MTAFNITKVRSDFPILNQKVRGNDLVYLDSAASAQRPQVVIDAISEIYTDQYANVHRGVHFLSDRLTARYENARAIVAKFIGARDVHEVVFTKGTTESVNVVASGWGHKFVGSGDTIVVTALEHHANFVPWQVLAKQRGARFVIVEIDSDGTLDEKSLEAALALKPKIFAITQMSNSLGTILPIKEIAGRAKAAGAMVFVDGAQGVCKLPDTLADLGEIDFLAFSGHKICGPSGVGVLWGRKDLLNLMEPYNYGGAMIDTVGDQDTTWTAVPWKFEAGTPHIAGVIALGVALEYVTQIGRNAIASWESQLLERVLSQLKSIPGIILYGPQSQQGRGGVISFGLEGVHPHDIGSYLDTKGIAIRVGHHCTQPLMRRLGVEGTARASFYFYNSEAEADFFVKSVAEAKNLFLG